MGSGIQAIPANNMAVEDAIAFLLRSGLGGGPPRASTENERARPRGVGGCELGALQSKSWHVPTRRQMKHQRVRHVSW